jgi:aarF domain-containing kinase
MLRLLADLACVARGARAVLSAQVVELARLRPDAALRWAVASAPRAPPRPRSKPPAARADPTETPTAKPATQPSPRGGEAPPPLGTIPSKPTNPDDPARAGPAGSPDQPAAELPADSPPRSSPMLTSEKPADRDTPTPSPTPSTTRTEASRWTAVERAVPETPLARVLNFGVLGAGLVVGAAAESMRRAVGLSSSTSSTLAGANGAGTGTVDATPPAAAYRSTFVTDANAQRLASSLSRMRGAALKLGQMLSIQDQNLLPAPLHAALERVRQGADIMPRRQLVRVLRDEFGSPEDLSDDAWMSRLSVVDFDYEPIAAASIGQVHTGFLQLEDSPDRLKLAFKVQYPGVARSIASDISNVKRLISATGFIPDKFYVDEALAAAKEELERECDYVQEADYQNRFRACIMDSDLAADFYVPKVIPQLSTSSVLASEFVDGVPIDRVKDKAKKTWIASRLLRLTLAELFEFRFMQTDPNFANFLYGVENGRDRIYLIDFGAAREFDPGFVSTYFDLICACADRDRDAIIAHSTTLGFLTGEETKIMLDAHFAASIAVGEPFRAEFRGGYNFENNDIPARTAKFGKVMLEHRLTPPPKEAYSLHRRLSGAFLTALRLGATIDCATMLDDMRVKMAHRNLANRVSATVELGSSSASNATRQLQRL